jgi:hypothetical protein
MPPGLRHCRVHLRENAFNPAGQRLVWVWNSHPGSASLAVQNLAVQCSPPIFHHSVQMNEMGLPVIVQDFDHVICQEPDYDPTDVLRVITALDGNRPRLEL